MTGDHMEDYMGLGGAHRSTNLKNRMGGDDKLLVLRRSSHLTVRMVNSS